MKARKKIEIVNRKSIQVSNTKTLTFILGASMVRNVDGYLVSINRRYVAKAREFSLAKTTDTKDYIKPTKIDFDPILHILHIGTNDRFT